MAQAAVRADAVGFDPRRRPGEFCKPVAHRGASAVAPENTMAAFERAWLDRADIEMDVRLSAVGEVVGHARWRAWSHDGWHRPGLWITVVAELKRLDAGAWFGAVMPVSPSQHFARCCTGLGGKIAVISWS